MNPVGVTKIRTLDASQAFFVLCWLGSILSSLAFLRLLIHKHIKVTLILYLDLKKLYLS